jgi:hypothetical protein
MREPVHIQLQQLQQLLRVLFLVHQQMWSVPWVMRKYHLFGRPLPTTVEIQLAITPFNIASMTLAQHLFALHLLLRVQQ